MYALQYNEKKVRYSKYNTFIYQQTDQRLKVLIILRTREVHAELQHMPEEEAWAYLHYELLDKQQQKGSQREYLLLIWPWTFWKPKEFNGCLAWLTKERHENTRWSILFCKSSISLERTCIQCECASMCECVFLCTCACESLIRGVIMS